MDKREIDSAISVHSNSSLEIQEFGSDSDDQRDNESSNESSSTSTSQIYPEQAKTDEHEIDSVISVHSNSNLEIQEFDSDSDDQIDNEISNESSSTSTSQIYPTSTRTITPRRPSGSIAVGIHRRNSLRNGSQRNSSILPTSGIAPSVLPLPHAYPVGDARSRPNHVIPLRIIQLETETQEEAAPHENEDEPNEENTKSIRLCGVIIVIIIVAYVATIAITIPNSTRQSHIGNTNTSSNVSKTTAHDNLYQNISLEPSLAPISSSHYPSSHYNDQSHEYNISKMCFTDPHIINLLEWQAYERGDDPSIPRTYHFCPNSHMSIFDFDLYLYNYDYSSGYSHPIFFFRPNINILCGFDGDYGNNCTLQGGAFQIIMQETPLFVDYSLNTTAENITISGFRFTGARGYNIASRCHITSLTVKNCRFDNNYDMFSSIFVNNPESTKTILHVQNCTFENNTYMFDYKKHALPNLGVISSYALFNPDVITEIHISNSIFSGNTFHLKSLSGGPEFITGAIINLFQSVRMISVTDSFFCGNKGYSSGLILMGRSDHEGGDYNDTVTAVQSYSGNHFSDNVPIETYADSKLLSCILLYQTFKFQEHLFWPSSVEIDDDCEDYVDSKINNSTSNEMCLI